MTCAAIDTLLEARCRLCESFKHANRKRSLLRTVPDASIRQHSEVNNTCSCLPRRASSSALPDAAPRSSSRTFRRKPLYLIWLSCSFGQHVCWHSRAHSEPGRVENLLLKQQMSQSEFWHITSRSPPARPRPLVSRYRPALCGCPPPTAPGPPDYLPWPASHLSNSRTASHPGSGPDEHPSHIPHGFSVVSQIIRRMR